MLAGTLNAQRPTHLVAGRVVRPGDTAGGPPVPVMGQWVVLHRVGSDRAGPMDSARTNADGRFQISYRPFGAQDALYFVSSRYAGIAYFSPPLREVTVRGGDADVIVYDTTSDVSKLRIQGRHFVLSQARGAGRRREVAEVFEVDNEGTRTIVAADSMHPVWSVHVPAEAESLTVAPGDVTAGAVLFRQGRADVFAPISPGVRQLVIMYRLRPRAFPLSQPMERSVSVFEVLLEEPKAIVEGARLSEVAPASIEGRTFRRFLAQDVPGSAVIRINAPAPAEDRQGAMKILASVVAFVMLAAIGVWTARRRTQRTYVVRRTSHESEALISQLAALDASFERRASPTTEARAEYERDRAALKDRIARALAEEEART